MPNSTIKLLMMIITTTTTTITIIIMILIGMKLLHVAMITPSLRKMLALMLGHIFYIGVLLANNKSNHHHLQDTWYKIYLLNKKDSNKSSNQYSNKYNRFSNINSKINTCKIFKQGID